MTSSNEIAKKNVNAFSTVTVKAINKPNITANMKYKVSQIGYNTVQDDSIMGDVATMTPDTKKSPKK